MTVQIASNVDQSTTGEPDICSWTRMLHHCVRKGDTSGAKISLEQGASPNTWDENWIFPVIHAVNASNIELLRLLIVFHANVNVISRDGDTPLHLAIKTKNLEMVKTLLKAGADVNAKDKDGMTPAMLASQLTDSTILQLLIKADLNVQDYHGNTALHHAVKNNMIETAVALIKAGAKVNIMNNRNRTPISIAFVTCRHNLVNILINAGATVNGATAKISPLVPSDVIRAIVPEDTPFWLAANNDAPMLAAELAGGLDPNTKTENGMTLLHWACAGDAPECVLLLLDAGADEQAGIEGALYNLGMFHPDLKKKGDYPNDSELDANDEQHYEPCDVLMPIHFALSNSQDSAELLRANDLKFGCNFGGNHDSDEQGWSASEGGSHEDSELDYQADYYDDDYYPRPGDIIDVDDEGGWAMIDDKGRILRYDEYGGFTFDGMVFYD